MRRRTVVGSVLLAASAAGLSYAGCVNKQEQKGVDIGASQSVKDLMVARGLTDADVEAALKTYVPPGKHDEYMIFASGGQSGNLHVMGVPSMRQLKTIAVFSPESWQGYGVGGDSDKNATGRGEARP
jgi:nitrous-oxide reductase